MVELTFFQSGKHNCTIFEFSAKDNSKASVT